MTAVSRAQPPSSGVLHTTLAPMWSSWGAVLALRLVSSGR